MNYFNNISYTLSHMFLMLFLYLFITHRYSKKTTAGICFFSFMALNILDCLKLNIFPDSDLCYAIVTVLQIILTQSTGIVISSKRNRKVLFIGLSASNYVIVGSIASCILYIYTGNQFIALTGSFFVHLAVLYIVYKGIRDLWLKQYETEYTQGWWALCLVPVFFYCSFSAIAFFPNTLYEMPQNIPGIVCFMATMFVSYTAVLRYIESESKRKDAYWKNMIFESYIKGLESQYYLVGQAEKNLKVLRHDIRHYSSMISLLLEQGEYEEAKKIVAHINDVTEENKVVRYCNNLVVNAIITKMVEKAEMFDIDLRLELSVPQEIPVNEYEFTAVIANLFENAIICVKDLQKEKRYIDVKIHCSMQQLLIQMKNAYEREISLDVATGLPKSQNGEGHGLGMQSIQAFSDKIKGDFDCFCQEGIFFITLFAKF
ncbi:GHKL domain-containing protein [Lachnospiraceae bacterium]|nr:GHKL domain-containing protein [Lachnospiraceae bacterium]